MIFGTLMAVIDANPPRWSSIPPRVFNQQCVGTVHRCRTCLQYFVLQGNVAAVFGHIYIYALGSRAPTPPPPPPMVSPPPLPCPRPPAAGPCSRRSRTTGTNPRKPERGRTMENDPSQCFFTGAENRIRAGTGRTVCKEKRATSYFVW